MELKEAIRILNWSQQQMRLGNLPDYSRNVNQAIKTVLQVLENSISKDKIREKIEEEKKIVKTYYGGIKYQEGKIAGLKELLKEE